MALAIIPKESSSDNKILSELPIQIPLPDPATIPAWVHAALDRWDTSRATYLGLEVLRQQYPLLQSSYDNPMERDVFRKLRVLALSWQRANYRTYITSFEKMLLDAEIKALRNPLSTRRSDTGNYPDIDWILDFIQKEIGGYSGGKQRKRQAGIIMGKRHILATLDGISAIYTVCDTMGVQVQILSNYNEQLQSGLHSKRIA
jgi:hypothetical protein